MAENWDHTYDVLVAGTGGAAFGAAISAAHQGLKVLMVESTNKWGGSTAMSGGGIWLPNNPLMKRDHAGDSREEALDYLEATVGVEGPATSRERKEAFVDTIDETITTLERLGMEFARSKDYPDYYPERPGGKIGRALEVKLFDAKELAEQWWETSRGKSDGVAFPMMTDDVWLIARAWSTPGGFMRGAKFVFRGLGGALRGRRDIGMGAGLSASFMRVALKQGTEMWLKSPVEDLVVEDGRVVGAVVNRDGRQLRVKATHGVVLASGGFAHNAALRGEHHGVPVGWSSANKGNIGTTIEIGQRHGAAVALMDDAWWGASIPSPGEGINPAFLVSERSMPFSMIVDAQGDRFANESESYVDLGHRMLEHSKHVPGRFWMIADARHSRRYLRTFAIMPGLMKGLREKGMLHTAKNLPELARAIGADPGTLRATIERFNGFARAGVDGDFGRGNSAYDRYYGDPLVRPNPNLGPLEKGPFTAYEIVPGDLGTKGGLLTDADARVLREDGSVIEGLYSAGNNSASVMGRTYPGPGSTIAPALVFGFRAGKHMAKVVAAD
ncbi:MAG: FAD-binding protein [Actinomycetota bacterium]